MGDTLVLVHILFRHGDRTPEKESIYPTDPHGDNDYYPIGYGQLTNKGKQRSYKLGQILRKNYDQFLGDVYSPEVVTAYTSDFDRTKATLQLVLASLFPPKKEQIWDEVLPWQPIPYTCCPIKEDNLFLRFIKSDAEEIYQEYMKGEGRIGLDNNSTVLQHIEKHSGMVIKDTRQVLRLACTLKAESDLNLELPDWTSKVWPHPIEELATYEYDALAAHPKLKFFTCGNLLNKIVQDSKLKIEGESPCKIYLYSGHEMNVAVFLRCLGIYVKHIPPYCSNVRVEFHRIGGKYGFKFFYQPDIDEKPQLLTLPKFADSFLPVEMFETLVDDILNVN